MDTATLITSERDAIGAGIKSPNESRQRLNLPPVTGGDTPYLQQQNYSLEALNRRDQQQTPTDAMAPAPEPADDAEDDEDEPAPDDAEGGTDDETDDGEDTGEAAAREWYTKVWALG